MASYFPMVSDNMVSENSPSFTHLSSPPPAHNGSRALVSLATSPSPSMETSPARGLAQQEQRFKELCEVRSLQDTKLWTAYVRISVLPIAAQSYFRENMPLVLGDSVVQRRMLLALFLSLSSLDSAVQFTKCGGLF